MAGNIKGITIEFRGDTTKLSQAMSKVKTQAKGLESQVRGVDKALKFNPRNTELLAQKQQLLKEKISKTKDELEIFKSAQKSLDAEGVSKTSRGYLEVRRNIIEAESKLKTFERQLKNVNSTKLSNLGKQFEDVGARVKAVGDKMKNVGKNLTMKVTAPIAGLGGLAIKASADFEAGMSQVKAISGATGKDFEALKEKAKEMGRKTKFSASQSAEALKYMAMAGWDTSKMIKGLPGIMNLAAASGEELATVSDIVTDSMTAFGLKAEQSGHFADVLAVASSKSNTNVGLMGETFKYVAPVAGALGYSCEDTALAMGLMANAGLKGSQAGTSLRSIMTRLAAPTGEVKSAMNDLGISLTDSSGKMKPFREVVKSLRDKFKGLSEEQRAQYASSIAGQQGMAGLLAMMGASDKDFTKLINGLQNADGAAKKMADTMQDNLAGQITTLKGILEGIGIEFGEIMTPAVRKIVEALQSLATKFHSLSPTAKKIIVIIATVVAAIGPLLLVLGTVISGIGSMIAIIGKAIGVIGTIIKFIGLFGGAIIKIAGMASGIILKSAGLIMGALKGLFAFVAANPIVLVITAIIAAIVLVIRYWDEIKAATIAAWNGIVAFLTPTINEIKNFFTTSFTAIKETLNSIWEGIKTVFEFVWNAILLYIQIQIQIIQTVITTVWSAIKTATSVIWEAIKTVITTIWDLLVAAFNLYVETVKTIITTAWEIIKTITTAVWEAIKTAITTVWDAIKNGVTNAINGVKSVVESVWNAIKSVTTSAWNAIKSAIIDPVVSVYNKLKGLISNIKGLFNFSISWPHIPMPHPYISPRGWKIGDILKGSIPKLGISWYKEGGIFDSPSLIGVGEAGSEAVVPTHKLDKFFEDALKRVNGGDREPQKVVINIERMEVRDDMDIQKIAKALDELINRNNRRFA